MRAWPALLLTPLFALASISLGYALVDPACKLSAHWMLHLSTLLFLLLNIAATAVALADLRETQERRRFIALVATWSGAFFSLVVAAQALTQAILSPCTH
jgi:hypothetical protein